VAADANSSIEDQKQISVLLVDDDPRFSAAVRRLLYGPDKEHPAVVHMAVSGAEALEILAEEPVDVVLLDYQMPGGTGLHWLEQLLASQDNLAVIMVTGTGSEEVAVQAMKNGAMDYLVKGVVSAQSLYRAIHNALDRIRLEQTISQQRQELLAAERHRVMIQSLGAACHHLGQPASVITTYLELMKRKEQSSEIRGIIEKCLEHAQRMQEIFERLRTVSEYRTEPYLPDQSGQRPGLDDTIVKI
jgi:FixJ family two-component response regulator